MSEKSLPPPSLSQLVRAHAQKQVATRRHTDQLRKEAVHAVHDLTDCLTDTLNDRVSEIFLRQKELEAEAKRLSAQTAKYYKQTNQWLALVAGLNASLKELGDVQNWAEVMERDMRDVMTTLDFVRGESD